MPTIISRYATPFVTGLFLVSLVSGIALFFHFGAATFHGMHEWLSMVLIIPFVLHIWKNWRPFLTYFKRAPMALALGISILAAIPFTIPSEGGSAGNPVVAVAFTILGGSVDTVAALYKITPETLMAELDKAGYSVSSIDQTLSDIVAASGKNERELMRFLSGLEHNGSPAG
jgi:hypothetical protein